MARDPNIRRQPNGEQTTAARPDRTTLYHLLILAAATLALYAQTLWYGFVADDNEEILKNELIRSFANAPTLFHHSVWFWAGGQGDRYYRPFKMLAYLVEYHLFHFHASFWHLVNLVAYLGTVVAVYFLARDLAASTGQHPATSSEAKAPARAGRFALATALIFALHPIHIEPVAWVAAGNDLFCALALILALWYYHRARMEPRPAVDYATSVVLFFAGMLFKETALTFPAILLAYDFLYRGDSIAKMARAWGRYLAYVLALGIYLDLRSHALGGFAPSSNAYHLTLGSMAYSVPVSAVRYAWKSLVPIGQNFRYQYQPILRLGWETCAAALVVVLLVFVMFLLRRRSNGQPTSKWGQGLQPLLSLALAWFGVTLAPSLALSKISLLFADRYLYIPSLGACIILACGWLWLLDRAAAPLPAMPERKSSRKAQRAGTPSSAYVIAAALLLFYAVLAFRRLPAWHDNYRLFATTEKQSPNDSFVVGTVGLLDVQQGRYEQGLALLQRAAKLDPHEAAYPANEASALMALGRGDEALRETERAVELSPDFPLYWTNLAILHEKKGEWEKAWQICIRGLALAPNDHAMLTTCGLVQWHLGRRDQAIAAYRKAIQADPEALDAYINLGNAYAQLHQFDAATAEFQEALRASPFSPDLYIVHFELGIIYETQSLWRPAALEYQQALRLNPNFAPARANLQPLMPFLRNPNLSNLPSAPLPLSPK